MLYIFILPGDPMLEHLHYSFYLHYIEYIEQPNSIGLA